MAIFWVGNAYDKLYTQQIFTFGLRLVYLRSSITGVALVTNVINGLRRWRNW